MQQETGKSELFTQSLSVLECLKEEEPSSKPVRPVAMLLCAVHSCFLPESSVS